jgi:SAM-dependent methyltransferase
VIVAQRVGRDFRDVDQATTPVDHVGYLVAASALDQMRAAKQQTLELLVPQPGHVLLDVGCGVGDEVRALAAIIGPTGRAVGVDQSSVMVKEACRRSCGSNLPVDFRQCNAHALTFADNTFDGCRVERTLQHVADPHKVLAEMVRVAKPGARIVALEPDWDTAFVSGGRRETSRLINRLQTDLVSRHGWIGRQLLGLFRAVGIADVTMLPEVFLLTDLPTARYVFRFDECAEAGQSVGLLAAADYAEWLNELAVAAENGSFLAGVTGFTVFGTKGEEAAG